MVDVSTLLYVGVDPDTGQPSSLNTFSDQDRVVSSILSDNIRGTTTTVYDNSAAWEAVRDVSSTVNDNSGTWETGGEATLTPDVSGPWQDTYEEVRDTSADIRDASTTLFDSSVGWEDTRTQQDSSSPGWNLTFNRVEASANIAWNATTEALVASGPLWNASRAEVEASSDGWNAADAAVTASGPLWNQARVDLNASSPNWNQTKVDLDASSPLWNQSRVDLNASSPNWNQAKVDLDTSSPAWNEIEDVVRSTSGDWETGSGGSSIGSGLVIHKGTGVYEGIAISGLEPGDGQPPTTRDGWSPRYSSSLDRWVYVPNVLKVQTTLVEAELAQIPTAEAAADGSITYDSQTQIINFGAVTLDNNNNTLNATTSGSLDISGIRILQFGQASGNNLTITSEIDTAVVDATTRVSVTNAGILNVALDSSTNLADGYATDASGAFDVEASAAGDVDIYFAQHGPPIFYREMEVDGAVRTAANEIGFATGGGIAQDYSISSTPKGSVSNAISNFYRETGTYYRVEVSSNGVYEIDAVYIFSSAGTMIPQCSIRIDGVIQHEHVASMVGASFQQIHVKRMVYLEAGQEIRPACTSVFGVNYKILKGSCISVRRVG